MIVNALIGSIIVFTFSIIWRERVNLKFKMLPLSTVFKLSLSDNPTKALEELNDEQFISA
jgi:hypothetical protein